MTERLNPPPEDLTTFFLIDSTIHFQGIKFTNSLEIPGEYTITVLKLQESTTKDPEDELLGERSLSRSEIEQTLASAKRHLRQEPEISPEIEFLRLKKWAGVLIGALEVQYLATQYKDAVTL